MPLSHRFSISECLSLVSGVKSAGKCHEISNDIVRLSRWHPLNCAFGSYEHSWHDENTSSFSEFPMFQSQFCKREHSMFMVRSTLFRLSYSETHGTPNVGIQHSQRRMCPPYVIAKAIHFLCWLPSVNIKAQPPQPSTLPYPRHNSFYIPSHFTSTSTTAQQITL